MQRFILDTNVFIEASKRYYAFDIIPVFWHALVSHAKQDRIISIDKVKNEIIKEDLKQWAEADFAPYFRSTKTSEVMEKYTDVVKWAAQQSQYKDEAKNEFYDVKNADAFVIAYVLAHNLTLVTEEKSNLNIQRKIPIPNVCRAFEIKYVDTFDMLRSLGFRQG
ncbi:MAG: DUF4411 family protein [Bacteroidota bacterium]